LQVSDRNTCQEVWKKSSFYWQSTICLIMQRPYDVFLDRQYGSSWKALMYVVVYQVSKLSLKVSAIWCCFILLMNRELQTSFTLLIISTLPFCNLALYSLAIFTMLVFFPNPNIIFQRCYIPVVFLCTIKNRWNLIIKGVSVT
jgi:hypothetical protein